MKNKWSVLEYFGVKLAKDRKILLQEHSQTKHK